MTMTLHAQATTPDVPQFPIDGTIGRYRLRGVLAPCAGDGAVYLADEAGSRRPVALKVVGDPRERQGARLQHYLAARCEMVPQVYECFEHEASVCIAMEYVQGQDLDELIGRGRPLPVEVAARIARDLCTCLAVAHGPALDVNGRLMTIVHGDVKPANIRLTPSGGLRLLDYGLATALALPRSYGYSASLTPEYASPERLATGILDVRSDLWSVGVMLYEALAGRTPWQRPRGAMTEPCPPLPTACPSALAAVVGRALARRPVDRYESADAMRKELDAFLRESNRVRACDFHRHCF